MGYTTKFSGGLKLSKSYNDMSEEVQERVDFFLEDICDGCVGILSETCSSCLEGLDHTRVPLLLNNEYIEWDLSEKAYNVYELLRAFVFMMRLIGI